MDCPICSFKVADQRGLAAHFRHQAATHPDYTQWQEDQRFDGKAEGQDFVVCLECGHRAETLARHLKAAHGITANDYRAKHGDVPIRCGKTTVARREAITAGRASPAYAGTKAVTCPSCGQAWQASKFLATMHDHRCTACQEREDLEAEQARWVGKSEPADYVECRVCGWRGENITGHLQGVHPETTLSEYRQAHPDAPWFISSSYQLQPSANKANLTEADLAPFKDEKGRVQVALAADTLNLAGITVLNYCKELKIPTRNRLAMQKRVLDTLAALLSEAYAWEWSDQRITNPATGYKLFFDGYFAGHNLLVEVHGAQHFKYVPEWHKTEAYFKQMVERDAIKLKQALALGFKMLVIRHDEPHTDPDYLRQRLLALGVS